MLCNSCWAKKVLATGLKEVHLNRPVLTSLGWIPGPRVTLGLKALQDLADKKCKPLICEKRVEDVEGPYGGQLSEEDILDF